MLNRLLLPLWPVLGLLLTCLTQPVHASGEPLNPQQAFRLTARAIDAQTIEARWQIEDGYYMYRDKFRFETDPANPAVELAPAQFPPGEMKDDENFGKVETYRHEAVIRLPLKSVAPATTHLTLKTRSQGCADIGICYPPVPQEALIELPAASAAPATASTTASATPATASAAIPTADTGDETSRIARLLKNASLWTILLFFFGSGLALAFTPCMLPMVPILSGLIVGHGHDINRRRALLLSSAYVLGMALTYAAVGVAAGYSGTLVSAALQNPWMLGAGALIFITLAASMFGLYELQMPSFLQGKLRDEANRQQGGQAHGAFLMGTLSAAIVGPCVAAPLAGALLYIAKTGDALMGGAALFVMGLGMGLPLLLIGTSARHLLPKPGPWMNAVNRFFGVLLLGVAIWLIAPVIPVAAQMLAWAALLIIPAIYLHALDPLPPRAHGWQRFGKALGVISLLLGSALLIGVLGGSRDPLQPLAFLRTNTTASQPATTIRFEPVHTLAELDARLKNPGRPVMLDFYADWCISCKEMERLTFADPTVAARLNQLQLLKVDVTADTPDDRALLQRFGLFGPPGIIFFDAQGQERPELRVVGFQPPEQFGDVLKRALAP
jgi:thiol:disulfide interchange protein DsbD